jgi:type VI secretion system protein VasD
MGVTRRQPSLADRCLPRPTLRSSLLAVTGLLATALLASCAKPPPPPKPKVLTVELQAAPNLNPNVNGRPSPVVVRLYELKSVAQFQSADFLSLFEKDQSLLGADVAVREEFVLSPGESKSVKRDIGGDSKFVAVMAAFRDLERAKWRASVPLDLTRDNTLAVRLEASTVQLAPR